MKNYELPVPVKSEYERFMLNEIDSFLGISAKFSPEGAKRIRIFGFLGCLAAAGIFFIAGRSMGGTKPYIVMVVLILLGISLLGYGKKPIVFMESFLNIIKEDGIERIYSDMQRITKIEFSTIYVGKEYIFDTLGMIYRLKDVTDVFIKKTKTDIDPDYILYFRIYEKGEDSVHMIRSLKFTSEKQRMEILAQTREIFGFMKYDI